MNEKNDEREREHKNGGLARHGEPESHIHPTPVHSLTSLCLLQKREPASEQAHPTGTHSQGARGTERERATESRPKESEIPNPIPIVAAAVENRQRRRRSPPDRMSPVHATPPDTLPSLLPLLLLALPTSAQQSLPALIAGHTTTTGTPPPDPFPPPTASPLQANLHEMHFLNPKDIPYINTRF